MSGIDTPNLRKRPARGTTSKYSLPPKPSVSSPPNFSNIPATSPAITRSSNYTDGNLTSSFLLSSPMAAPHMGSSVGSVQSSFAAKRKALKFPDRNLPEKISTFIPESKLYTSLLDFEKRLDLSLARRQLDVQEAMRVRNTLKHTKIIRLTIFNTYAHQSGTYHLDNKTQNNTNEPASWTLRIEGRVEDHAMYRNTKSPKKRFSSFIKKAFFQLGDDVNNTIEWDRAAATGETDGWEIKRTGDQEIEVKITIFLEHSPSKVKLSPLLSALLGMHTETRPRILMSLWQYIKANRLLDANDRKTIMCDDNLKIVFGCESMQFGDIPKHLRTHLAPPDPIELSHVIKLTGDPMEHAAAYEITVEVDDTIAIQPSAIYKREIANIEEQISQVIQQVNEHKRKRDFMLDFHSDPVFFLTKLVDNQIKNDKLIQAYPGRDPEEERKTAFFYQPYVEDAVQSFVSKHNYAQMPQVKVNFNIPSHLQPPSLSSSSSVPVPVAVSGPSPSLSSLPPSVSPVPTTITGAPLSLPLPNFSTQPSSSSSAPGTPQQPQTPTPGM